MKASIHIDNKEIWQSSHISILSLEKKANELKIKFNCQKVEEQVRRGFKIFTR